MKKPNRETHYGLYRPEKHGGGLMSLHPTAESAEAARVAANRSHFGSGCDCGGAVVMEPTGEKLLSFSLAQAK